MRYKVTSHGFPTVTISKISKGAKLYAERNAAIASSTVCGKDGQGGKFLRRRLMITELEGENYVPEKKPTAISQAWSEFKLGTKQTLDRKRIGERSYVLYEALADEQKVTFRSCFPGTIMRWDATPMLPGERYDPDDSVWKKEGLRPHGVFCAVRGSFLVAELAVKGKVFHTGDVAVKRFSMTDDSFQKFSGNGNVCLEVHGDLQEIPLYPGESVDVWPGYLLGFTDGVELKMMPAGDMTLRNEENNDYVIRLTAPRVGGFVYTHSVRVEDFFAVNKS